MASSLYDISVASFLQILRGVAGTLDKGLKHCQETGQDPNEVLAAQLADDMLPFTFQLFAVVHQSAGAIAAIKSGEFSPPAALPDLDYAGYQGLINDTIAELEALSEDDINALAGGTVIFKMGGNEIPFTTENFVLSFATPNLMFHATTAYDLLRQRDVPLSKIDYLGSLRIGV
ncbi:MAG: DUF1993 domain-containing protein [Halioglobus sp.]